MKNELSFFVGTYATPGPYIPEAKGRGILSCCLDLASGEIKELHQSNEEINATYLAKDRAGHLFAVCDNFEIEGEVRAYNIREDAALKLLSMRSTFGTSSCHIEYAHDQKLILISSYSNGQLGVHKFDKIIDPDPRLLNYAGSGPNPERQEASHIHHSVISPDKRWLYACDLGSDIIWVHDLSEEKLQVKTGIPTPPGSGPRHMVCHPDLPLAYLFCELDATIITYNLNSATGRLEMLGQVNTLPIGFTGEPAGAAVRFHPTAKSLYVSNRNHNSLTAFSISGDGELKFETNFPAGGKDPRDFNIDPTGQWLLCANQNSHNIATFRIDPEYGLPTGEIGPEHKCGTPVCILF